MDTLTPEQAKHAGLSQEDEHPHMPAKGARGDSPDAIVDDFVNDRADIANDVKESGESGMGSSRIGSSGIGGSGAGRSGSL